MASVVRQALSSRCAESHSSGLQMSGQRVMEAGVTGRCAHSEYLCLPSSERTCLSRLPVLQGQIPANLR